MKRKLLKDFSKSRVHEFLGLNHLLGEYDVMCLTENQRLFVCEVKITFSTSKRLKEDAEKAWKQAMKDDLVFKAINSDLDFIDTIPAYKLVAFPNQSRALFTDTDSKKNSKVKLNLNIL